MSGFYTLLLVQLCDKNDSKDDLNCDTLDCDENSNCGKMFPDDVWDELNQQFCFIHLLRCFLNLDHGLDIDRVKKTLVGMKEHNSLCHSKFIETKMLHQSSLKIGWRCTGLCGLESLPLDSKHLEASLNGDSKNILGLVRMRFNTWRSKVSKE